MEKRILDTGKIKTLLKRQGMTQRELAEKTGTTEVSISRYMKRQRTPRLSALEGIAQALGTNIDGLLTERQTSRYTPQMTEAEALRVLTGTRDDYNDYARALNIAIRVLRERVAEIDKKSQNQRREREANYESNKHY